MSHENDETSIHNHKFDKLSQLRRKYLSNSNIKRFFQVCMSQFSSCHWTVTKIFLPVVAISFHWTVVIKLSRYSLTSSKLSNFLNVNRYVLLRARMGV